VPVEHELLHRRADPRPVRVPRRWRAVRQPRPPGDRPRPASPGGR
jgi:hypothetical protein